MVLSTNLCKSLQIGTVLNPIADSNAEFGNDIIDDHIFKWDSLEIHQIKGIKSRGKCMRDLSGPIIRFFSHSFRAIWDVKGRREYSLPIVEKWTEIEGLWFLFCCDLKVGWGVQPEWKSWFVVGGKKFLIKFPSQMSEIKLYEIFVREKIKFQSWLRLSDFHHSLHPSIHPSICIQPISARVDSRVYNSRSRSWNNVKLHDFHMKGEPFLKIS